MWSREMVSSFRDFHVSPPSTGNIPEAFYDYRLSAFTERSVIMTRSFRQRPQNSSATKAFLFQAPLFESVLPLLWLSALVSAAIFESFCFALAVPNISPRLYEKVSLITLKIWLCTLCVSEMRKAKAMASRARRNMMATSANPQEHKTQIFNCSQLHKL